MADVRPTLSGDPDVSAGGPRETSFGRAILKPVQEIVTGAVQIQT